MSSKSRLRFLRERMLGKGAPGPVEAFKAKGEDFVVASTVEELVARMNEITPQAPLDATRVREVVQARDRELTNPCGKDAQVQGIHNARRYLGDRIGRVATPHRILDPAAGLLIGFRLQS